MLKFLNLAAFKVILTCFLLVAIQSVPKAQGHMVINDIIRDNLIAASLNGSHAKLFVHYDKTIYVPNETIWFTAYLLNSDTVNVKPSILSVVLVNNSDRSLTLQKKFVFSGVTSSGSFLLPDSIAEGTYSIIAYANHLIKGSPDILYTQQIAIKRPELQGLKTESKKANKGALTAADPAKISVRFYPEGGDLVENLPAYVGWEALDGTGGALKLKALLMENGRTVDTIATSTAGMGRFFINPKVGRIYTVKLLGADGYSEFALPAAKQSGVTIGLRSALANDTLILRVASVAYGKVHIVLHNTRQVFYVLTNIAPGKSGIFRIALDSVPRGLAAVTVYNEHEEPCAERIFFAHYDKPSAATLKADRQQYRKRQKVTLKLNLNPAMSSQALISIACIQSSRIDRKYFNDIDSYGFLNEEVNGFRALHTQDIMEKRYYLEDVLLVKGWRRYTDNPLPYYAFPDSILIFHGSVTVHNKQPRKLMTLTLMVNSGVFFIGVDRSGNFIIPDDYLIAPENKPLTLFATGEIAFNTRIKLTDPYDKFNRFITANTQIKAVSGQPYEKSNDLPLSMMQGSVVLNEVKIRGARGPLYQSPAILGMHTNACGDYVGFCGALNCAWHIQRTSVPIQGHIYYRHGPVKDGWIQYNIPFIYSGCETKNQSLIRFAGISINKEYYPYTKTDVDNSEPLYNSTLYWNGQVALTAGKQKEISFYTGDISSNFSVIMQGITPAGVVYDESSFEVEK